MDTLLTIFVLIFFGAIIYGVIMAYSAFGWWGVGGCAIIALAIAGMSDDTDNDITIIINK